MWVKHLEDEINSVHWTYSIFLIYFHFVFTYACPFVHLWVLLINKYFPFVAFVVTSYAAFVKVIFISRPFGVNFNLAV